MHHDAPSLWKHSEFFKLWTGQTVSLVGSQITLLALPLAAILSLHATAFQIGILRAATSIPVLLVGLVAGAWVDRMRRRRLLIVTDLGRAVVLGSIPLAAFFHVLRIEQLYIVAFLTGTLTIFFDVAHTSYLPTVVSREQLVEGNSKLEVSRSAALIAGPGLAGVLISLITAPIAIIVDALSFIGSAWFISRIRIPDIVPDSNEQRASIWSEIWEGLQVLLSNYILRTLALSLAVYNFFSSMISAMLVLYATNFLGIPPSWLGLIYAIACIGFPIGALLAQPTMKRFGIGPTIVWAACISDAAFLLIPLASKPLIVAIPLLIVAQFIAMCTGPITAINQISLWQAITPERLQGRVSGTMRFIALCATPLGALIAGTLGETIGLRFTVLIGALGIQIGFLVLFASSLRQYRGQPEMLATK